MNFFKTTLRSLWKNKGYSFLNIAGLAIGIACAALIFLWVEDEKNYDAAQVKKDNIYLVKINSMVDAGVFTHSSTPTPMAPAIQAEIPGIENTCRFSEEGTKLLFGVGDKAVYAVGNYAEPSVFNMFTLPFVQGNAKDAFAQVYSLVITEKTAKKFFGNDNNVIGKSIRVDNAQDYVVSGVVKDFPENSSIKFEWLAPFKIQQQLYPDQQEKWGNFNLTTYVELKPGVTPATIDKKLDELLLKKQGGETSNTHPFLFGMKDWRLYNDFVNGKESGGGRIQYVHLFSLIAWIILFIACINFMNLATARSEKRAREVGVRKVLGAGKKRLVLQFIGEALFMSFIAAIVAVLIVALLLPLFNALVQKNLSLGFQNPIHLIAIAVLALLCGLIAGSYPSFYLSSFNPVFVLKGIKLKTGSAAFIRKGLVVLQFTVSIVLIVGTVIIYQQIQHIKSRNIGYSKDNLLEMQLQGDMQKNFTAIKQDLINSGVATNVALADHKTITSGNNTSNINWEGKNPNSIVVISQRLGSPEFISTAGLQLQEGRDLQTTDIIEFGANHQPKDVTHPFNVVITETMATLMGKGSAVGKLLTRETDMGMLQMKVVGVVKDYVYGNMYGKSDPVIFYCIPQATNLMYVRMKNNIDPEKALTKIAAIMKANNPAYPFEYKFVDDEFNNMFLSEMLISKLSRVFAALAIIISCLGLFGLAAYTAEQRKKEIGVRKVLGANTSGIAALLSKDFIKLVGIACIIAFPIAWWMMKSWLQNYEYRITMSWWIFLIAGMMAMVIALLTVSFQAIKAALANPIKSLRTE